MFSHGHVRALSVLLFQALEVDNIRYQDLTEHATGTQTWQPKLVSQAQDSALE